MASLSGILEKYKQGPSQIDERGRGGAVLALALHCLMVKDGYRPAPYSRQNPVAPATDWNDRYKDEWVFEYTRKGYDSIFILHCSLQAATARMFVQGREKDNSSHVHNLGLVVEKYIVSADRCKLSTWQGVFENEDVLTELFEEYIASPLKREATPSAKTASSYDKTLEWMQQRRMQLTQRAMTVPIGLGLVAAATAVALVYFYREKRHR